MEVLVRKFRGPAKKRSAAAERAGPSNVPCSVDHLAEQVTIKKGNEGEGSVTATGKKKSGWNQVWQQGGFKLLNSQTGITKQDTAPSAPASVRVPMVEEVQSATERVSDREDVATKGGSTSLSPSAAGGSAKARTWMECVGGRGRGEEEANVQMDVVSDDDSPCSADATPFLRNRWSEQQMPSLPDKDAPKYLSSHSTPSPPSTDSRSPPPLPAPVACSGNEESAKTCQAMVSYKAWALLVLDKPRNETVKDAYRFGRMLGEGHSGEVYLVEHKRSRQLRACKSVKKMKLKGPKAVEELRSEVAAMLIMRDDPNTVKLYDVFEDEEAVHLIMDAALDGDLFEYLAKRERVSETMAALIVRQVAAALRNAHGRGLIHRDVKPENLLLCGKVEVATATGVVSFPKVKLADWGLAMKMCPGEKANMVVGSGIYMAPEVLAADYSREADVWSLGATTFVALSGYLPFWGDHDQTLFASIKAARPDYVHHPWPTISREAKELVQWMLDPNPLSRATAADVMTHPWVSGHCKALCAANLNWRSATLRPPPPPLQRRAAQPLPPPLLQAPTCPRGSLVALPRAGSIQPREEDTRKQELSLVPQAGATPESAERRKGGGGDAAWVKWRVTNQPHGVMQVERSAE